MIDKSNISPKAWELLNNLTASIHRHVENHNPTDYVEKARAEDALADYISALEAEVEVLRPFRDGYDIKEKQRHPDY